MVLWPFKWNIHLRDFPVSGFRLSGSKCDVAGGLPEVTRENPLTVVMTFGPQSLVIMDLISQLYVTSTWFVLSSRNGLNPVEN